MKHLLLLFVLFIQANLLSAQVFDWAIGQGDTDWDHTRALASDASGNVYAIGYFQGTVDFDPSSGVFNLTSNGNADAFILKIGQSTPLAIAQIALSAALEADGTAALNRRGNAQTGEFGLKRSGNGWHWETLATVDAQANAYSYAHQDLQPLQGTNLYRIRQIDADGGVSHYNQVAVLSAALAEGALSCYPNPARDRLTVQGDLDGMQSLQCFGLRGEDVSNLVQIVAGSNGQLLLDLSELPQGTYLLKAGAATSRIVKL